nr:hypothetical protein [Paenibacillus sp. R14(2021)]
MNLGVMAGGFLMIGSAHTVWTVALSVFLIGLAEGMLFPLSFIKTAEVVPKLGLTTGISLLLACVYACQFLSPLFVRGIELLLHTNSVRGVFIAVSAALAVTTVIYLPFARNRKRAEEQPAIS